MHFHLPAKLLDAAGALALASLHDWFCKLLIRNVSKASRHRLHLLLQVWFLICWQIYVLIKDKRQNDFFKVFSLTSPFQSNPNLYIHSKEKRGTTENICHLRQRLRSNSNFSLMFWGKMFTEGKKKKKQLQDGFRLDSGDWSLNLSHDLLQFQCMVQKCMLAGSCSRFGVHWVQRRQTRPSFWFLISHPHACGLFFFLSRSNVLTCGLLPDAQQ